jgi:hypothetical protein
MLKCEKRDFENVKYGQITAVYMESTSVVNKGSHTLMWLAENIK